MGNTLIEEGKYFGTSLYLFLMNKARYDGLPKELRVVIDRNSGHPLAREMGRVWRDGAADALRKARERGNVIHVLQGEESTRARQALQRVLTRWRAETEKQGIDGGRLIERAREAIARNKQTETQDGRRQAE